jgi:hypothetical protein
LKFFKIGETGTYSIGKDVTGTYLSTGKNHKFYLNMEARAKLVEETQAFNAAQEKRLRDPKFLLRPKRRRPLPVRAPQGMQPKNFLGGKDRNGRDIDLS